MRVMLSKKLRNEEEEAERETRVQKGERQRRNVGKKKKGKFNNLQTNLTSKENKMRYQLRARRLVRYVCVVAVSAARRRVGCAVIRLEPQGAQRLIKDEYSHSGLP